MPAVLLAKPQASLKMMSVRGVSILSPLLRVSQAFSTASLLSATTATKGSPTPKPFSEMPGINGWPIFGHTPKYLWELRKEKGREESHGYKLQSKFGPIFRWRAFGDKWMVSTSSPEATEAAFRFEGAFPSRGVVEDNFMWLYENTNTPYLMFFSKGAVWKEIRSAAAKQVIPRRVYNFVEPLAIIAEEFLAHLESILDESGNIQDIRPELHKWAFQGVSYFVYGEKIDIYSAINNIHKQFIDAALNYFAAINIIAQSLPLFRLISTKPFREYKKSIRKLTEVGKQILDRRYEEIRDAISSGRIDDAKPVGLLDQWLIEGKYSEEQALFQSYDMLSAGIDTTSNTAIFLLYELAKQPELQERLVQEISSVVGDKEHPSWEDLQKMTLVRNCVKETMRLYNPTTGTVRTLAEDAVLLGYQVPAGTNIFLNMSSMGLDEQLFEDAKAFKPDRWNKEAEDKIHPFSSLPFGFGPRSCYGRRLAEMELYLLVAKMLCKYRFTTETKNLKLRQQLILKADEPIKLHLQPR